MVSAKGGFLKIFSPAIYGRVTMIFSPAASPKASGGVFFWAAPFLFSHRFHRLTLISVISPLPSVIRLPSSVSFLILSRQHTKLMTNNDWRLLCWLQKMNS